MSTKVVLIFAVIAQVAAAILALRLNKRYRWYSAWALISGASTTLAILELAVLGVFWDADVDSQNSFPSWSVCLSALLASVLFVSGVAMIEPLFLKLAAAEALLKKEKRRLENVVQETAYELQAARHIQQRLLPAAPPTVAGFDLAGVSFAAEWTSGDYFDFLQLADGTLGVVLADVSGHGLGPALLMTATRAYLRAMIRDNQDVGRMLTLLNHAIAADVDQGRFVTIFLARFDPAMRTLCYASAGHECFLLGETGAATRLTAGGPPLGVDEATVLESSPATALQSGDIFLLVSDGITEAESPKSEQFGDERMIAVVHANREKPAHEIVLALVTSVREFTCNAPQRDDMTAVVVKVEPF